MGDTGFPSHVPTRVRVGVRGRTTAPDPGPNASRDGSSQAPTLGSTPWWGVGTETKRFSNFFGQMM